MNSYTLNLSSNSTNFIFTNPEIELEDHTKITINMLDIDEKTLPTYLKIDWGDGTSEIHNNDLYQNRKNVNIFSFSSILSTPYVKEYFPSETCLYKSLTAQVFIHYADNTNSWFILPIKIRTYDYFESIYDLKLVNTNLLPRDDNPLSHQFITGEDGFLVELHSDH